MVWALCPLRAVLVAGCVLSLDDFSSEEQGIPFISTLCVIQMLSFVAAQILCAKILWVSLAGEKWLYNPWAEAGSVKDKVARQIPWDHLLNVFWRKKRNEDGWKLRVSHWGAAEGWRQQGDNYLEVFGADFLVCGKNATLEGLEKASVWETVAMRRFDLNEVLMSWYLRNQNPS